MKKLFIISIIFLFKINLVLANTTVAFIDMKKVISTSKPGSSIMSQLNDIILKNENKFKSDAKKLKEQEVKLISQKNILSEIDFQSNLKKLKLEIKSYNENRNKINVNFNKLRSESTNKLLKLINPFLINYAKENSILIMLQKKDLVMGNNDLDITDDIIKVIDKEIKQFKIQ